MRTVRTDKAGCTPVSPVEIMFYVLCITGDVMEGARFGVRGMGKKKTARQNFTDQSTFLNRENSSLGLS